MSGSNLEIYIVGGAGLFFLASGCLKLIVVSCQECWEDYRRMRGTSAPRAAGDRLLTPAPRGDSGHLGGQQRETGTVAMGIAALTVGPNTHREVPRGQWTPDDPEWVVDGVIVSAGERDTGGIDGQQLDLTVATVAAVHPPPAGGLPADSPAESGHQFSPLPDASWR